MSREELLDQAIEVYNDYCAREFDDAPQTKEELGGVFSILSSTFEAEGYEDEINIDVFYNSYNEKYFVVINTTFNEGEGEEAKEYIESANLEQFIDDMKTGTFESLYNYFVDAVRERYNLKESENEWEM